MQLAGEVPPETKGARPGARHGVVAPYAVGPGGPRRSDVRAGRWRRVSRGLYVPADVPRSATQRVVEVGAVVPRYAAVTGWAALCWHGARWSDGSDADGSDRDVVVWASRRRLRPQAGIRVCEERWDHHEVTAVDGVAVARAVRAVTFEMRHARSLVDAVVAFDMAAYDDLVDRAEVAAWVASHSGLTGIQRARDALALVEENSWSPMETRTRLAWVDRGGPGLLTNRPVFDLDGRHLLTPDLLDPEAGVVVEYDGDVHLGRGARRRDRDRDELYREHRLEVVRVMAGDHRDAARLDARRAAAYARAARHRGPRSWTTRRPRTWTDTSTVALRRELVGVDRDIWLGYRRAA